MSRLMECVVSSRDVALKAEMWRDGSLRGVRMFEEETPPSMVNVTLTVCGSVVPPSETKANADFPR